MNNDEAKKAWQSSVAMGGPLPPELLRFTADKFYRRMRLRNNVEYAACVVAVVVFSIYTFTLEHVLQRIGSAMIVLGTFYAAWQLNRRASAVDPASAGTMPIMEFVRGQFVRQRDALQSIFWWYLLPFVPGLALVTAGSMALRIEEGAEGVMRGVIALSVMLVIFVGVGLLNLHWARKLQQHIDRIDALLEGTHEAHR
jgi:hypothetical protein